MQIEKALLTKCKMMVVSAIWHLTTEPQSRETTQKKSTYCKTIVFLFYEICMCVCVPVSVNLKETECL